jgi:hypothetical protein
MSGPLLVRPAMDPQGRIDNITSHIISGVRGMSTTPSLTEAAAVAIGQAEMPTHFPAGALGASLPTAPGALFIVPQVSGPARLARGVTALFAEQVNPLIHHGREYVVDALTGAILASGDASHNQYRGSGRPRAGNGLGIHRTGETPASRSTIHSSFGPSAEWRSVLHAAAQPKPDPSPDRPHTHIRGGRVPQDSTTVQQVSCGDGHGAVSGSVLQGRRRRRGCRAAGDDRNFHQRPLRNKRLGAASANP